MLNLIENKAHHTKDGLLQLVKIKAAFPKGLTIILKHYFPKIEAITLPEYNPILSNINFYWLSYFINTDGSFFFNSWNYTYY